MADAEIQSVLDEDDLRDVDRLLLDYLSEGRVTPVYCKERLEDDGKDYTRGYIHNRLTRLSEHGHIENLRGVGLYEIVSDPRMNDD